MPSSGRFSPDPGTRLPQRVALGVLLRDFPPPLVDEILDDLGRREQRQRLLPARLMVYFTLGMWIFRALPYELILAELLRDAPGLAPPVSAQDQASAAAIGRARRRLGVEPLRRLFEQAGESAPDPPAPALPGRRPLRLCDLDVGMPATPANLLGFPGLAAAHAPGPSGQRPGRARIRLLVECGSSRITHAEVLGAEEEDRLPAGVGPDDLLILDARPLSAALWSALERLGTPVLWPLPESAQVTGGTRLPDGSVLAKLPAEDGSELVARVLATGRGALLATSLLDHRAAPAAQIAACHDAPAVAGRRFHGIGGYGHDDRLELRSKDPDMVRQELYAMLCVHHAIGELVGPNPGDSGCF